MNTSPATNQYEYRKEAVVITMANDHRQSKISRTKTTAPTSFFIRRLTDLIENNLDDDYYGIDQLCRDAGASRTQIHNKVKKWTGLSTSIFVRNIRLQNARKLLLTTDLNICQVAYEVGFSDPRYFSRLFSELFGCSPRIYRRRQELHPAV